MLLEKVQFTVQINAKVFKTVHYLHWQIVDVYGVMWGVIVSDVKYELLCFCDFEAEVIVCTSLCKVSGRSLVGCD